MRMLFFPLFWTFGRGGAAPIVLFNCHRAFRLCLHNNSARSICQMGASLSAGTYGRFGRGDVPRATRARPEYVRLRFLLCPTCMNSAALRTRSVGQGNYAGHTHLPAYEKRRGSYRAFFAPSADNNVAALQFLTNQTKPRLILFNHVYPFKRVAKAPLSSEAA